MAIMAEPTRWYETGMEYLCSEANGNVESETGNPKTTDDLITHKNLPFCNPEEIHFA